MQIFEELIVNETWKTKELDGDTALSLALEIMQIIGPALATASSSFDSNKELMEQSLNIPSIVSALMSNFNTGKVTSIIKRLLQNTWKLDVREHGTVEVRAVDNFSSLFAGKKVITHLPKVLFFVISTNFGNFSNLVDFTSHTQS